MGARLPPQAHALSPSLRRVLDAIAVPTYAHRGGAILHANPAMLRLSGYPQAVLSGFDHAELATQPWRESLRDYGLACMAQDADMPAMELSLLHAQGKERQVEVTARRLLDEPASGEGEPALTVLVTCQDLSDIQHVQGSMLSLSQMLNQIINGGPMATFVIDTHRRVTHWNRACQLMTGLEPWEMLGRDDTWRAFYPQPEPLLAELIATGHSAEHLQQTYGDGIRATDRVPGAYEGESFVPKLGDNGRWLYFSAAPLHDVHGTLVGAVQTMQDVTERHEAQAELLRHRGQLEQLVAERSAELRSSVDQLAAFMENSPLGVVHMVRGVVTHHNHMLAEMFGSAGQSMVGRRGATFFATREEYGALMREAVARLRKGAALQRGAWMCQSDGSPLWVQIIAYSGDVNDPAAGTWWLLQDRTAFRRAQDELQSNFERLRETNQKLEDAQNQLLQQDKMASIGLLAAGVAHEINNPIAFVGSNLHTLRGYVRDLMQLVDSYEAVERQGAAAEPDPALRRQLAQVKQRVEIDYLKEDLPKLLDESDDGLARVKRIVQDLKDFSRVDQEAWQDADLNAGLESTLNVVMHEVKYKATVERRLSALPPVRCLAAQLNQVFMNLIVNASQAIVGTGVITLSSGHFPDPDTGGWVWVEVADTGSGMDAQVMRRVFEPFFTTKAVGKGTGLGLSLSFSIVQRHGGLMRVRSAPGEGTAFKVWVPVAGPQADGPLPTPPVDY